MAGNEGLTIQHNAHQYKGDNVDKYSLMLGGLNVTHEALAQYDPLITGYGRLFMVRTPAFMNRLYNDKTKHFKHILEYGNTAVSGVDDVQLQFQDMQGGYAGRQFAIPTIVQDGTESFTVQTYEFSGSPIREYVYSWINGISDLQSGLTHYGGLIQKGDMDYNAANHSAEFIYVVTDRTGMKVEYACMFANCVPTNIKNDQFNTQQGSHEMVQYDIQFRCTKYEGLDINKKAQLLLKNYQILVNSLEFNSGLGDVVKADASDKSGYNANTGMIEKQDNIEYRGSDLGSYERNGQIITTNSWTQKGAENK